MPATRTGADPAASVNTVLIAAVIEIGAGWVPDMIRRLDHAAEIWARSEPQLANMKRKPSEQIGEQLAAELSAEEIEWLDADLG